MTSPLLRAVEVMDRLRSPGGCPWDAEQTHASLARYLVEETYEVLEAIESDDPTLLREELGDLLLQVLFHARLAEELPPGTAFSIDEVAGDLVEKLIRRHPHVFTGTPAGSAEDPNETWERLKIVEKGRTSAVDGVPLAQPALALSAKLVSRARRAGLADLDIEPSEPSESSERSESGVVEAEIGAALFALVEQAVTAGIDPESALRAHTRRFRNAIVRAEADQAES